jgi:hypothetical protein
MCKWIALVDDGIGTLGLLPLGRWLVNYTRDRSSQLHKIRYFT